MDPVGPWSTYAPYNRLAGVQASASGGDLHHHLPASGGAAPSTTTTAQLIPGGFLSPPPVAYETVFTPLFHHAGAKAPTHYVAQHRPTKQMEGDYHQPQAAFFEPTTGAWQQNSPFGILPHESVVSTTSGKSGTYENFNPAHFAAQSLNHLATVKNASNRAQSPQVNTTKTSTTQGNSVTFFQVSTTFASTDNKTFSSTNTTNLQQSCIVSTSSNTSPAAKEYRVPQAAARAVFLSSPNRHEKQFTAKQSQQIQTKAQTKIYPELNNQTERPRNADDNQSQSSPISFTSNYTTGNSSSAKRTTPQFQQHTTYRHYQGGNVEGDFQRPKSGSDYPNTNGPDCNVAVPRRPSPLQAHSQASPLGHAPSPAAYPIYNSPMNSISSPQQNSTNQVTPPSPLDVSVPRPNSQTGNVAYPSVITRALNSDKTFQERYDRQQQQNNQNSNCWQDRSNQNRKFNTNQGNTPGNNYPTPGNSIEIPTRQIELPNRTDPVPQRTTSVQAPPAAAAATDRQQGYFETGHQVTLQDLSSCRGDPMTIVKNLQQTCHVPQSEVKQDIKAAVKRRKSNEKVAPITNEPAGAPSVEYFTSRIPPPAHSSAANQQQQNGTYFDFDRWNLPPPATKIFGTQGVHQQHQGLMVPHPHTHHPPPPLPYFPPFHLPPHPPEFSSSVELTPVTSYNEQAAHNTPGQFGTAAVAAAPPQEDNQPKVVVPNIEEELNFLSEGTVRPPNASNTTISKPLPIAVAPISKPIDKPTGPGAGFMSSYLKFLQGERDSSPPPATRGARKQTWSRTPKTIQETKPGEVNGVVTPVIPPPPPVTRLSQGDPQDDPRYFPLPKERKRSLDSSDEGLSSDDDLFNKKVQPVITKSETSKEKGRRGRQPKSSNTERKRKKEFREKDTKENDKQNNSESNNVPPPRRETSKRAAKEKVNMKQLIAKQGDDELEEPPEFVDSDSDPAWTPQAINDPDEQPLDKRRKRGRPVGSKKKGVKNLLSTTVQGTVCHEADTGVNDSKKQQKNAAKQKQQPPTLEDNIAAAVAVQEDANAPAVLASTEENPFKSNRLREKQHQSGEFVAIRSELNQEWPAIWRVDGKTLLQKYEPFEQNGQTLYRNISTYTSWTPENKKQYVAVPVRCRGQSQMETVVEFLRSEMTIIDQEFYERMMKECEVYQDNFEVYIQTLISQALDSNFLTEIFQEKDEYFLSNVKTIDDITESKKQKLLAVLGWPQTVHVAVSTWPCYNVIRDLYTSDMQQRKCAACFRAGVAVRVLLYGQPYNSTTLEGCQPDPQAASEKDFLMCRICVNRVELLSKITHQKYLMYIECAKRVTEKRTAESHKDTTCILNELLADENWLNQLFLEVRSSWAEVDSLEHNYRSKKTEVQ